MEGNQTPPASPPNNNRTVLWIIGGVVALCLCAAVGVVVAAAGFIYLNAESGSQGRVPLINEATPQDSGGACDECGVTMDIPDLGTDHVDEGTRVNYNSNPPSSGPHYGQWLEAGLYEETVEDGYLVHNLEHGYVIIWYNCETLSGADCDTLKQQIADTIEYWDGYKIIGMNREGNIPHVLALTSWTKLAYLNEFDEEFINLFIRDNRDNSPEPNGP